MSAKGTAKHIVASKDDAFLKQLKEWQKDPEFRRAVKEFVKLTTS